ncbi:hypothetical protein Tco_0939893 [Tanacetum coccineum]|uniref:Reverse transcriptase domain-containing protein n=1 Tax=Tanacetum coccineum TaxID=301880 RepID=A0ABQ5DM88_9ASTR
MPPLGFSTPPQIPNIITSERLPMNTTVFAATTPENTPSVYRASTSANPNPMISHAFVEANYEVLKSLLRERRRQIRNEDLRSGLEYFNEDYDGEREMKPRPEPNREATPTLRLREGRREGRNTEGSRPSETKTRENGNKGVNLPPLLAVHLGRNESGQPLQSSLTSVHGGHPTFRLNIEWESLTSLTVAFSPHQRSNNLVIPSSLYTPTGLMPIHVNPYSQPSTGIVNGQPLNFPFQTQIGNPLAGGISAYHSQGGRTSMQEMESWEKEWNEEGSQKTPPKKQKGVFSSYAVAEEKVVVNDKYLEQTITFEKQISKHFKGRLQDLLRANANQKKKGSGPGRAAVPLLQRSGGTNKGRNLTKGQASDMGSQPSHGKGPYVTRKMPFGLQNAGANIPIDSMSEEKMLADIKETFEKFLSINMKLNPKKCLGVRRIPSKCPQWKNSTALPTAFPIRKGGRRKVPSILQSTQNFCPRAHDTDTRRSSDNVPDNFGREHKTRKAHTGTSTYSQKVAKIFSGTYGNSPNQFTYKDKHNKTKKSRRVAKWAIELGEHDIAFQKRGDETPKDFLTEVPPGDNNKEIEDMPNIKLKKTELSCEWNL